MSRRIEITVPNEWADPVRSILNDKCSLSDNLEKPNMIVEVQGTNKTIFFVTVPGPAVSPTLEQLRKNGIGVSVGRIILTSIDYLKPDLARPLSKIGVDLKPLADTGKPKALPLKGFQHFQKARKTTEEMYNDITNQANMNMNTWMNLVGASLIAAGGLTTNATVFIVAAMLVSPIMGPILGMTFAYRIADFPLFRTAFINEIKMAIAAFLSGALFGLILGDVGSTFNWPNSAMLPSESQGFNLIVSILVSAAAGVVLGVSLTSTGGNALVGTAISAGLLPPIVNAGMLIAYSFTYCPKEKQAKFYEMGNYQIVFYATHVVTIVIVANFIFWLKNYDARFKDGEDADFDDIPALAEHKKRLEALGHGNIERAKAEYFIKNITDDLKGYALDAKDRAEGIASFVTGGLIQRKAKDPARSRNQSVASNGRGGDNAEDGEVDLEAGGGAGTGTGVRRGSFATATSRRSEALSTLIEEEPVHNPFHDSSSNALATSSSSSTAAVVAAKISIDAPAAATTNSGALSQV